MKSPIFDAHCDTILKVVDEGADLLDPQCGTHINAPAMLEAGLRCQVFACFVSREHYEGEEPARVRRLLQAVAALDGKGPFVIPRSREELAALKDQPDRAGLLLAVEGGEALGGDPAAVEELAALGVRYITLAWGDNELCGSSFGENRGLSELGRRVVAEMERHRVLVDVSHMSDAALADTAALATRTYIASHSSCRAICPAPRNLTDDQLRLLADQGGVAGVNFASLFLTRQAYEAQWPIYGRYMPRLKGDAEQVKKVGKEMDAELAGTPRPPLSAVADHVAHMVKVAGVESAALGSDLDGFAHGPEGLEDCRAYNQILDELQQRGIRGADLEKVCWGNWDRVFKETF